MMETTAVLRKIRSICKRQGDGCMFCKLDREFCERTPENWTDRDIEEMADFIDDFEEEDDGSSRNT